MKKLDVSAAKVAVRHAVEQIVEAGLGQGEPGQIVEHARANWNEGIHADRQAERQPEHDEHYAAAHVRLRKFVVPGEGSWRLIRAPRGPPYTYHQLHVEEDRRQSWQPNQYTRPNRLFQGDTAEPATAKVRTYVQERLQGHHSHGDQPDGDDRSCYTTRRQAGVPRKYEISISELNRKSTRSL